MDLYELNLRLAGVLLVQNGGISLSEIEALPFVKDRREALAIAKRLLNGSVGPYRVTVSENRGDLDIRLRLNDDVSSRHDEPVLA